MRGGGTSNRRFARSVCAFAVMISCSGALAAGAVAASLKVTVLPATVHKGKSYAIVVKGTYQHKDLKGGKAYLISLIQYSPAPCKATAQLENSTVRAQLLQFYLAPLRSPSKVGIFEHHSPFQRVDDFKASVLGARRVCAYLYPKLISAGDTVAPIATASRQYKVIR